MEQVDPLGQDVTVEDLLEDRRIGHEPFTLGGDGEQGGMRPGAVGMVAAHQVHRDVGVDEDRSGSGW
ncbi:MAG: hypothetical protein R3C32_05800 [Chloroflexota bacterium]